MTMISTIKITPPSPNDTACWRSIVVERRCNYHSSTTILSLTKEEALVLQMALNKEIEADKHVHKEN